jgi:phage tail sheath protein FI
MPQPLKYPGVYIEEAAPSSHTIVGAPTSVVALVGGAQRGPDNQAVTLASFGDFNRAFGGLWSGASLGFAVRDFFVNGGGQAIVVRVHNGATAAKISLASSGADVLALIASSLGAWGNALTVTVDHDIPDVSLTKVFNLTVAEDDNPPEKHLSVSIDPNDSRYVPRVLSQSSRLVRVDTDAGGNFIVPTTRPVLVTAKPVTTSGGDGSPLDDSVFTAAKQGIHALDSVDFNLLAIPPFPNNDSDITTTSVLAAAVTYCEARHALFLIDPPPTWQVADAVSGVDGLGTRSANAALYYPRLSQPNPLNHDLVEEFAPAGAVAGVIARIDGERGVWKAPAGIEAGLVAADLAVVLTDSDIGQLNPLGINCLRGLAAAGNVVWGARTLAGDDRNPSQWKYLPVRRLALHLEQTLLRGTQWAVFEPNDERLWSQIRLSVGSFMNELFRQGAFQGQRANEAYLVKCDAETTSQDDIDRGVVNIVVGFAPLKPAEFVILQLQQMAGQIAA